MYYEEKIINDVIHVRGTPDGEWRKLSDNVLTDRIVELRATIAKLREALEEISGSLRGDTPATSEVKRIADEALEETK